jgi:hypothetical protein
MNITLDRQVATKRCDSCKVTFTTVRGSVFDAGVPFGLYLIALHGHSPRGPMAHLAVAVLPRGAEAAPVAAAMEVISMPDQIGYSVVNWTDSPWLSETYLGQMLDRDEVLESPLRPLFLHVGEHVVRELPEVRDYLR